MAGFLWIAMMAVGLAGSRRRREYRFVVLVAIVGFAIQTALAPASLFEMRISAFVLVLGLSVVAFTTDLLVAALADGRDRERRRAWDFDHALHEELQVLKDGIATLFVRDRVDSGEIHRAARIEASRDALERVRRLRAPNPDWEALKVEYVEIFSLILEAIQDGDEPDNSALDRRRDAADKRWVTLRRGYVGLEPR